MQSRRCRDRQVVNTPQHPHALPARASRAYPSFLARLWLLQRYWAGPAAAAAAAAAAVAVAMAVAVAVVVAVAAAAAAVTGFPAGRVTVRGSQSALPMPVAAVYIVCIMHVQARPATTARHGYRGVGWRGRQGAED